MSEPYDMDRLGGPPGLFDSPNRERESTGGIVQRVRVPDAPGEKEGLAMFVPGRFNTLSLNDSDNNGELDAQLAAQEAKLRDDAMCSGVLYRKSITGDKM